MFELAGAQINGSLMPTNFKLLFEFTIVQSSLPQCLILQLTCFSSFFFYIMYKYIVLISRIHLSTVSNVSPFIWCTCLHKCCEPPIIIWFFFLLSILPIFYFFLYISIALAKTGEREIEGPPYQWIAYMCSLAEVIYISVTEPRLSTMADASSRQFGHQTNISYPNHIISGQACHDKKNTHSVCEWIVKLRDSSRYCAGRMCK